MKRVKLDSSGSVAWSKRLRQSVKDYAYSICATSDSGFAVAGTLGSGPHGRSDAWLIKLNRLGDTLWTKTYGGPADDGLRGIVSLPGGFLLTGFTNSFGAGSGDFYVVRTNAVGDTLWTRRYGHLDNERAWSADIAPDSGFVIGGIVSQGVPPTQTSQFFLVRINQNGDSLWARQLDSVSNESSACVHYTQDGGFALVGTTIASDPRGDLVFVKIDGNGAMQWRRVFGSPIDDTGTCVRQCDDGGYLLGGMVHENSYEAFLAKTDESGFIVSVDEKALPRMPAHMRLSQNYPNPFNPTTQIAFRVSANRHNISAVHISLSVYDLLGRVVATILDDERSPGEYTVPFDGSHLSSGVYFYRLTTPVATETRKMIVLE